MSNSDTSKLQKNFSGSVISSINEQSKEGFKYYLRKIGSGTETSKSLSRRESSVALNLILNSKATPAQIGAFLIAHRIRRPEPQELAGMLDTYKELGPKLISKENQLRPLCFGMPFDGRNKTSPIYPLTFLILLANKQPLVLHGGKRMPIKYGVTSQELFQALGLKLSGLSLMQVQSGFYENDFAFIYQPDHFPLADSLILYRDEIGKRPPIASMELLWTAHQGEHLLVSGFVHPPTEDRAWQCLQIVGEASAITIKGLEGSTDLPISRTCIASFTKQGKRHRLILHPRDYDCYGEDLKWQSIDSWRDHAFDALNNKGALLKALNWNAGTYLWLSGASKTLQEGINQSKLSIASGIVKQTLSALINWKESIDN